MELVLALVLFVALIAAWLVLPGSAIAETEYVTSTEGATLPVSQHS